MCHDRVNQETSTVPERRILEDALSCNLHKIGASLIEKVVDVRPHPEPISQATQDRIQFKALFHKRMARCSRETEVDRPTGEV